MLGNEIAKLEGLAKQFRTRIDLDDLISKSQTKVEKAISDLQ